MSRLDIYIDFLLRERGRHIYFVDLSRNDKAARTK